MVTLNEALAQLEQTQISPQDNGLSNLQRVQQAGILGQSSLGFGDRYKYGFADEGGKLQILANAGYNTIDDGSIGSITRLQNGEYGVRTEYGIKPVDPKGLQLTDIASDIAESIGKTITTTGAVGGGILGGLAGGVGAVGGAAAGGAAGEALRQNIGERLGVRAAGWQSGDVLEVAAEGLLSGAGEGIGRVIAGKLANIGARKMAASQIDDALNQASKEIQPTVLSKVDDIFFNNDYITKKVAYGQANIVDGSVAEDTLIRGSKKLNSLVQDGLEKAGNDYDNQLIKNFAGDVAGLDKRQAVLQAKNNIMFDVQSPKINPKTNKPEMPLKDLLTNKLSTLESSALGRTNPAIINQAKIALGDVLNPETKIINYNQMIDSSSALDDIIKGTFKDGKPTKLTKELSKIQTNLLSAKNENSVFSQINKEFSTKANLLKGLQKSAGIRLSEGEIVEGIRSPAKLLLRLKDEFGADKLQKMENIQNALNKYGYQTDFMKDITDGLATLIVKSKAKLPFTGGWSSPKGLAKGLSNLLGNNELVRARMFSGIAKTRPEILNKQVGKYLGSAQALQNLFLQNLPEMKIPMPEQVKQVAAVAGKAANSKIGRRIIAQSAIRQSRSLNQILGTGD